MGALTDALKNFGPFVSPLIFTLFPVCLTLLIISVVWSRKILKSMSVNNEIDYKKHLVQLDKLLLCFYCACINISSAGYARNGACVIVA